LEGSSRASLWWIPLVFGVLFAAVGIFSYRALERSTHGSLRQELETLLDADVEALRVWVDAHRNFVRAQASDSALQAPTSELLSAARSAPGDPGEALRSHPDHAAIREMVAPDLPLLGYRNFAVLDRTGLVLADGTGRLAGQRLLLRPQVLEKLFEGSGEPVFYRPVRDVTGRAGPAPITRPVFHVAAPIRDPDGRPIGALGYAIPAEGEFSDILAVARKGESGETYAFDESGRMLSRSRFPDQLVALGLLPEDPEARASAAVEVRDPGGNLVEGFTTDLPVRARPLTLMAASAVSGENGSNVSGYRDYRGVPVIGAWTWFPRLDMGIATEIDRAEAYAGLDTLRRVFAALAATLLVAALGMGAFAVVARRAQGRADRARRLGRYQILEKIGEGGMGKVYRARHALLRRPTAVKLLEAADASKEAMTRFEREVQATSSLTHPNTIAVYDYGHTPDGTFYYAMEFLEGSTVGEVVAEDGPQPEARVLHLMKQAAGSLAEAHAAGMVHRDLKPNNLMLCRRGGMFDVVKVLDFGLVRSQLQKDEDDVTVTKVGSLTGTPLYMSPEALEAPEKVDSRSDVYQLGAIAYYLLAGEHVFAGSSMVEVLSQHLHSAPEPPSKRAGRDIGPDLERLVLACLAKDRDDRPADGAALLDALEACAVAEPWDQRAARSWWADWLGRHPAGLHSEERTGSSLPSGWEIDYANRSTGSRA
jgi:hypothetical protein